MVSDMNGANEESPTGGRLAGARARLGSVLEKKQEKVLEGNRRVAKNRIALFVIKVFVLSIVLVLIFIIVGALCTEGGAWKEAYPPMLDILQKVFLPVVTLAFGFYNANKAD